MLTRLLNVVRRPTILIAFIQHRLHKLLEVFYAKYDSTFQYSSVDRVLFIDCGSNLGQGYSWFSKFFSQNNIDFELFEPNPNCHKLLEEIADVKSGKVKLNKGGIGIKDEQVKFYGLDDSEGGIFSQGGSVQIDHNLKFYDKSQRNFIEVTIFNFSGYLEEKAKKYDKIIVKMDIEGAEVDLLESMINDSTINFIDVLYVEFHSQFQDSKLSKITEIRENDIKKKIKRQAKPLLRSWH